MSSGLAGVYHHSSLGVYTFQGQKKNNRYVFGQLDGPNFLYYWDWGPNSGANWMISEKYWEGNRGIESYNLEDSSHNVCAEDLHYTGPMKVWNRADRAWQTDWNLRLECFNEELDCCDKVTSDYSTTTLHFTAYCLTLFPMGNVLDWDQVYTGNVNYFSRTYRYLFLLYR